MSWHDAMIAVAWNGLFMAILLSAVALRRWFSAAWPNRDEWLRKWVHMLSGIAMALLPVVTQNGWVTFSIAIGAGLTLLAIRFNTEAAELLSFVVAYRRGASWFVAAVAVLMLALPSWPREFSLAFLVLAFADPAAALVGMRFGKRKILKKTWIGSGTFFFVTLAIILPWAYRAVGSLSWPLILAAAVGALVIAAVELLSTKGTDNLTVPAATMAIGALVLSIV